MASTDEILTDQLYGSKKNSSRDVLWKYTFTEYARRELGGS